MKILEMAQENFLTHLETRKYPDCFPNPKKFKEWEEMESIAHTKPRLLPCRDCTVDYYNQMRLAGKCPQAGIPAVVRIFGKG